MGKLKEALFDDWAAWEGTDEEFLLKWPGVGSMVGIPEPTARQDLAECGPRAADQPALPAESRASDSTACPEPSGQAGRPARPEEVREEPSSEGPPQHGGSQVDYSPVSSAGAVCEQVEHGESAQSSALLKKKRRYHDRSRAGQGSNIGTLLLIAHALEQRIPPDLIITPAVGLPGLMPHTDATGYQLEAARLLMDESRMVSPEAARGLLSRRSWPLSDLVAIALHPFMKIDLNPPQTRRRGARSNRSPYVCVATGSRGYAAFRDCTGVSISAWHRFFDPRDRPPEPAAAILLLVERGISAQSGQLRRLRTLVSYTGGGRDPSFCASGEAVVPCRRGKGHFRIGLARKVTASLNVQGLRAHLASEASCDAGQWRNLSRHLRSKKIWLSRLPKPKKLRFMCNLRDLRAWRRALEQDGNVRASASASESDPVAVDCEWAKDIPVFGPVGVDPRWLMNTPPEIDYTKVAPVACRCGQLNTYSEAQWREAYAAGYFRLRCLRCMHMYMAAMPPMKPDPTPATEPAPDLLPRGPGWYAIQRATARAPSHRAGDPQEAPRPDPDLPMSEPTCPA